MTLKCRMHVDLRPYEAVACGKSKCPKRIAVTEHQD
jgi:hypothetical protein